MHLPPGTQVQLPAAQAYTLTQPMAVYYDPPSRQEKLHATLLYSTENDDEPLHMNFPGTVAGRQTKILIDTGASSNFMDYSMVRRLGLRVYGNTGVVLCGGKASVPIKGQVNCLVNINNYRQRLYFNVTDLPVGHPVILGNSWIIEHSAILDYELMQLRFQHNLQRYCFSCPESKRLTEGGTEGQILSILEGMQCIEEGCDHFLATIVVPETTKANEIQSLAGLDLDTIHLLETYSDVFEDLPPGLPPHRDEPFRIDLQDHSPISSRGYRLTPKEREQVESQIRDYLAKGWIRPSKSGYGSAVLFVQKKDGSLRMCVDYRALNKATVKDRYPLPRIDDLIDKLHGACVFSSLDLQSGYHQIRIADADTHKTAFVTPKGLYEYRVMPFGLCNAPSAFQRQMNKMLGHLPFVVVYLDDILVFSKDSSEHQEHLRKVLDILREQHFFAKLSKCSFLQESTKFLGYVVNAEGIMMDPDKVESILNWPKLRTPSEIRSFLGLCNHYKRFIKDYSSKVGHLNGLANSKGSIDMDTDAKALEEFQWLKEAITTAPVLAVPDFEAPFIVVTDASGYAQSSCRMIPAQKSMPDGL